jgi:hypothetical protein
LYTLISYPAGIIIEAVIVNRTRNRMRVVAPGLSDAFELRRNGQNWLADTGEEVQFEFLASDSPIARKIDVPGAAVQGAGAA